MEVAVRDGREPHPATAEEASARFAAMVEAQLAGAYRLASVILGDSAEAEDVCHDALLRAWLNFDKVRDPALVAPWLHRIVVNACRDNLRRRRTRLRSVHLLPRPNHSADPTTQVDQRDAITRAFPC